MKPSVSLWCALTVLALSAASATASAEEVPRERKGFQLALRTGAAIPFGNVSSTTKMSDALGVQIPFLVDLGYKPFPQLFVGLYLGVQVGGAAGMVQQGCANVGISCTGLGYRLGLLVQYNFLPAARANPWIGYGFGYEIGGSSGSNDEDSISNTIRGFELAHILGGADFRLQGLFGVGPFLDLAVGRYDVAKSDINAGGHVSTLGGTITDKAFHVWGIFGVRAVLFP